MKKNFVKETLRDCLRSILWLIITVYYIIKDAINFIGEIIRDVLCDVLKGTVTICFLIIVLCRLGMKRLVR